MGDYDFYHCFRSADHDNLTANEAGIAQSNFENSCNRANQPYMNFSLEARIFAIGIHPGRGCGHSCYG
jgi:hypothetical protein